MGLPRLVPDIGVDELPSGDCTFSTKVDGSFALIVEKAMLETQCFEGRSAYFRMALHDYTFSVVLHNQKVSEGLRNEAEALRRALAALRRKQKARDFDAITKAAEALLLQLWSQKDYVSLLAQYHDQITTMKAVSPHYGEMYLNWLRSTPSLREIRVYVKKHSG